MKAGTEQKLQDNEVVTYHVVGVAGGGSMAEDIWSGCVYCGIAASGRAGWPTAHGEELGPHNRGPCEPV